MGSAPAASSPMKARLSSINRRRSSAGLKTILASDPKAKGAKAEDFVDLRFIKELDDSGYIDKLYKR